MPVRPKSSEAYQTTEKVMQTFRMPRELVSFLRFGLPHAATALLEDDREALGLGRPEYLLHLLYARSIELREKRPGFDAPSTGGTKKR
jgi:hypothetical protein